MNNKKTICVILLIFFCFSYLALNEIQASDISEQESEDSIEDILSMLQMFFDLKESNTYEENETTLKNLAPLLLEKVELSYDNYEYYRSHISDTSNKKLLKLYSEGIIDKDDAKRINPYQKISNEKLFLLVKKIHNPTPPERPEYKNITNIPILMYHVIDTLPENGPSGLYVSKENFLKQIDIIKENNFNTITMEQLYNHWEYKVPLPKNPIVLTFDDGYISNYWAGKKLSKNGETGTFYLFTDTIGKYGYVSKDNIKDMHSLGLEIANHTRSHRDLRNISSYEIFKNEVINSNKILENIINDSIYHFCYPFGGFNKNIINFLEESKFKTSVTTLYGFSNKAQGFHSLRRIRIDYYDSPTSFLNKISN